MPRPCQRDLQVVVFPILHNTGANGVPCFSVPYGSDISGRNSPREVGVMAGTFVETGACRALDKHVTCDHVEGEAKPAGKAENASGLARAT